MEKKQMSRPECEEMDSKVQPAAAEPDLQSQPTSPGPQEVMSARGSSSVKAEQQNKQKKKRKRTQLMDDVDDDDDDDDETSADRESVLIHGLSVEHYRQIYHSVLQPSVLAKLSSARPAEYVSQVLELKQRLWTALSRPRLQETVGEDGRVEVTEIFDLT